MSAPPPQDAREAKLAQALRDNLRRRKPPPAAPPADEMGTGPHEGPPPAR